MPRHRTDSDKLGAFLKLPQRVMDRYAKPAGTGRFSGWVSRVTDWLTGKARRSLRRSEVPPEVWRALDIALDQSTPTAKPPQQTPPGSFRTLEMRREPSRPGEDPAYGQETIVTNSSNVYSYSYDAKSSTLYVTYLAPAINAKGVTTGKTIKGRGQSRTQMLGKSGSTLTGKTNARGAMYAYYDVPARVYDRMQRASSKGKFVWDELRVRGSMYGHRFRYGLVQGAVITQPGVSGVYIPRRATETGFRSRSVADLGRGKRGFQTSTLPEQTGFRTRRPPQGRGQQGLGFEEQ